VICTRLRGEREVGAKKRSAELGDQLLHGVTFVAEALAIELSVEARFVARPVCLMPTSA
jgi:hypothetical protein